MRYESSYLSHANYKYIEKRTSKNGNVYYVYDKPDKRPLERQGEAAEKTVNFAKKALNTIGSGVTTQIQAKNYVDEVVFNAQKKKLTKAKQEKMWRDYISRKKGPQEQKDKQKKRAEAVRRANQGPYKNLLEDVAKGVSKGVKTKLQYTKAKYKTARSLANHRGTSTGREIAREVKEGFGDSVAKLLGKPTHLERRRKALKSRPRPRKKGGNNT